MLLCLDIRTIGDGNHINVDIDLLLLFVHPTPTPTYPPSVHFNTQKETVYVSVDTDAVPIIDLWLEFYSTTGILLLNHPQKKIFLWIKKGREAPTITGFYSLLFSFSCLLCRFLFPAQIKTFYPALIEEMCEFYLVIKSCN